MRFQSKEQRKEVDKEERDRRRNGNECWKEAGSMLSDGLEKKQCVIKGGGI